MIARIKATGEIAEFRTGKNLRGEIILQKIGTASIFSLNEVEPIADTDWNQVRIQVAIEFAAQILGNHGGTPTSVAKNAVDYTNALINELQKKGGNNETD